MIRKLLALLMIGVCICRNYPLYKQCDTKWGDNRLGTCSKTICQAGCLMSSTAMALAGTGHSYNPQTLNAWLTKNGGYASGCLMVWSAINKIGLTFHGFIGNNVIKAKLDAGYVVIVNVHGGAHWVLAHGYSGDNILVNDPGFSTTSYPLSDIVNNNTGTFLPNKMPYWLQFLAFNLQDQIYKLLGFDYYHSQVKQIQSQQNSLTSE